LTLKYDEALQNFAFNLNLRRYNTESLPVLQTLQPLTDAVSPDPAAQTAGASSDIYSLLVCHPLLRTTVPVLIT
jgi:hypothetical protein